jgi:hypothetical protein
MHRYGKFANSRNCGIPAMIAMADILDSEQETRSVAE